MSQAKSNKMGVVQLTILTMVNMMGSGIIMLPTKLAEVGTISIISWLVTAVGSMALAWAFAKCGMFSRKSGGMGGYAEYAFGKSGNFMANYTYGVSLLIANVAIAISAVGYGTSCSARVCRQCRLVLRPSECCGFVPWLTLVVRALPGKSVALLCGGHYSGGRPVHYRLVLV